MPARSRATVGDARDHPEARFPQGQGKNVVKRLKTPHKTSKSSGNFRRNRGQPSPSRGGRLHGPASDSLQRDPIPAPRAEMWRQILLRLDAAEATAERHASRLEEYDVKSDDKDDELERSAERLRSAHDALGKKVAELEQKMRGAGDFEVCAS